MVRVAALGASTTMSRMPVWGARATTSGGEPDAERRQTTAVEMAGYSRAS